MKPMKDGGRRDSIEHVASNQLYPEPEEGFRVKNRRASMSNMATLRMAMALSGDPDPGAALGVSRVRTASSESPAKPAFVSKYVHPPKRRLSSGNDDAGTFDVDDDDEHVETIDKKLMEAHPLHHIVDKDRKEHVKAMLRAPSFSQRRRSAGDIKSALDKEKLMKLVAEARQGRNTSKLSMAAREVVERSERRKSLVMTMDEDMEEERRFQEEQARQKREQEFLNNPVPTFEQIQEEINLLKKKMRTDGGAGLAREGEGSVDVGSASWCYKMLEQMKEDLAIVSEMELFERAEYVHKLTDINKIQRSVRTVMEDKHRIKGQLRSYSHMLQTFSLKNFVKLFQLKRLLLELYRDITNVSIQLVDDRLKRGEPDFFYTRTDDVGMDKVYIEEEREQLDRVPVRSHNTGKLVALIKAELDRLEDLTSMTLEHKMHSLGSGITLRSRSRTLERENEELVAKHNMYRNELASISAETHSLENDVSRMRNEVDANRKYVKQMMAGELDEVESDMARCRDEGDQLLIDTVSVNDEIRALRTEYGRLVKQKNEVLGRKEADRSRRGRLSQSTVSENEVLEDTDPSAASSRARSAGSHRSTSLSRSSSATGDPDAASSVDDYQWVILTLGCKSLGSGWHDHHHHLDEEAEGEGDASSGQPDVRVSPMLGVYQRHEVSRVFDLVATTECIQNDANPSFTRTLPIKCPVALLKPANDIAENSDEADRLRADAEKADVQLKVCVYDARGARGGKVSGRDSVLGAATFWLSDMLHTTFKSAQMNTTNGDDDNGDGGDDEDGADEDGERPKEMMGHAQYPLYYRIPKHDVKALESSLSVLGREGGDGGVDGSEEQEQGEKKKKVNLCAELMASKKRHVRNGYLILSRLCEVEREPWKIIRIRGQKSDVVREEQPAEQAENVGSSADFAEDDTLAVFSRSMLPSASNASLRRKVQKPLVSASLCPPAKADTRHRKVRPAAFMHRNQGPEPPRVPKQVQNPWKVKTKSYPMHITRPLHRWDYKNKKLVFIDR